ncbi:MAG: methyltransferase domain-containing protein [Desulfuromonadales bacterium]|nr:methyltransferase domain-containing protein [Desulfuromonadales bacterium]
MDRVDCAGRPVMDEPKAATPCAVCGCRQLHPLLELAAVPVHCNRLWPTRQAALAAPRGALHLVDCPDCGHIGNSAFVPQWLDYQGGYENSLHFSPLFQDYALALARYLVEKYQLRGRHILEIGCGKGDFLRLLAQLGQNLGTGFDPSWEPGRNQQENLDFVADLFTPERAAGLQPDFVCCRQVLEHLPDPVAFLGGLRLALEGRPVPVFFEVPNAAHTISAAGIWDLIYEHPSFFSAHSLTEAFTRAGFRVLAVQEAFAGQYLWIEALAAGGGDVPSPVLPDRPSLERFASQFASRLELWRQRLGALERRQGRAVIWGAGSKGVTFLNLVGGRAITHAVDLNPYKQGKYLPGTGQRVIAPEELPVQAPDLVLVMNPIYRREIVAHLERLGLQPAVETL